MVEASVRRSGGGVNAALAKERLKAEGSRLHYHFDAARKADLGRAELGPPNLSASTSGGGRFEK
jgi:hypothetical protein